MAPGAGSLLVDVVQQAPDVNAVMAAISRTLRRSLGAGPVFLAPADPLTGAFSGAFAFDIPGEAAQAFAEIERGDRDIASFRSIAAGTGVPIASLYREADRQPEKSERWREVIEPLRWGDEIRAVVRAYGHTWGYLCLHREASERPFGERDMERLVALLPAVALAMRSASALADRSPIENATGVVLADARGHVTASTEGGAAWLDELGPARKDELPITVARLVHDASVTGSTRCATVLTASGGAAYVQAAPLDGSEQSVIAITISAPPVAVTVARFAAKSELSPRESDILASVLRGESTRTIAEYLCISPHTVQAHVTSIFKKTGVRSRRELVGRIRP